MSRRGCGGCEGAVGPAGDAEAGRDVNNEQARLQL